MQEKVSTSQLTPEQLLAAFSAWIQARFVLFSFEYLEAQRTVRRHEAAARDWDIELTTENSQALRNFCGAALFLAENEAAKASLDMVFVAAREAGDNYASFDFADQATVAWFDTFLRDEDLYADWQASGYDSFDLIGAADRIQARRLELAALEAAEASGTLSEASSGDLAQLRAFFNQ
jgi:hypothetical protein